jgi:hypothetical protein
MVQAVQVGSRAGQPHEAFALSSRLPNDVLPLGYKSRKAEDNDGQRGQG